MTGCWHACIEKDARGALPAYAGRPQAPSASIRQGINMTFAIRWIVAAAAAVLFAVPALAQEPSYKPGTVWNFSYIQVEPGQMQRYIDHLSGDWKKVNELGKKEGWVVSYHVFAVNSPRLGEPDLILAVESRDYFGNAEQLAQQKKIEALLAADTRKMEAQSGERKSMRKLAGSMELQKLILK